MAAFPYTLQVVLLISSLLLSHVRASAEAPKITLPSASDKHTASAGATVSFSCTGSRPVQWRADHYKNLVPEAEVLPSGGTEYESHIKIHNVTVSHVGYYSCSYDNCSNAAACSARIYLFVRDVERLLPMERVYFLKVPSNQDFVIPCKPSFEGVEVTLTQADGREMPLDYNPKEGYRASRSTLVNVRMLVCKGVYGRHNFNAMIKNVKEPYPPLMKVTGAWQVRHANVSSYSVLEGMTVRLQCRQATGSDGDPLWDYAAPPQPEDRVWIERGDSVRTLVIEQARVEDSGAYHCYVGNMFFNSSTKPAFIQVFRNDTADVTFFDALYDIHLSEMENVIRWFILFEAHPQIPAFKWSQNGRVLVQTTAGARYGVLNRHQLNVTREEGLVKLVITKPNMGDVGEHTLQACIQTPYRVCKEISFSLTVLGGPEEVQGRVEGGSPFVLQNSNVEVACSALGHPSPTLNLLYAACYTPSNCSQYENVTFIIQGSPCAEEEESRLCRPPAAAAVTRYRVPSTTPGKFICQAVNEHGSVNSTEEHIVVLETSTQMASLQPLSVDFALDSPFSKSCTNRSLHADPCTVYVPANLTLECRANIFHFSDQTPLLFSGTLRSCAPSSDCRNLSSLDSATPNIDWEQTSTSLTRVVKASLNVLTNLDECRCYECIMPSTNARRNEKLSLRIRVEEKINPYFAGNLSSVYEKEVHDRLELVCDVEGRPLPHVHWLKDGTEVQPEQNRISIAREGQSLVFEFLMVEDSGQYVCETDSQHGFDSIRQSTTLAVSDPEARSKKFLLYAVIGFSVVLGIIIIIFLIYIAIQFRENQKKEAEELTQGLMDGDVSKLAPNLGLHQQASLLPIKKSYEFPCKQLKFERVLGEGAFGIVYRARVRGKIAGLADPLVAVKKVKAQANHTQLKGLESEAKIMMHIGKHPNIVNLLGICTNNLKTGELQMIVEYCSYGNILDYMRVKKQTFVHIGSFGGTLRSSKKSIVNYANVTTADQTDMTDCSTPSSVITTLRRANSVSSSPNRAIYCNGSAELRPPSSLPNSPTYMASSSNTLLHVHQNGSTESRNNTTPRSRAASSRDGSASEALTASPVNGTMETAEENFSNSAAQNFMSDMTQLTYAGSTDLSKIHCDLEINNHTLVDWCYQIACGMNYLSKNKVLHGDLAARNILLADDNVVKISDFGFSKQLYHYEYKTEEKGPKPVKWMALEAVRDGIYSTQSDVWAFGVVMWEVFSLGQVPYPTLEVNINFINLLESGTRLEKPIHANDGIYEIMKQCWLEEPHSRPLFDELKFLLFKFLDESQKKQYDNLDGSNATLIDNPLLSKVRSPDIRCLMTAKDAEGYEVPRAVSESGSSGGMSHRNIHSLSIQANSADENGEAYLPMQTMAHPSDCEVSSPQIYTNMSLSVTTPHRAIRSPSRFRSISVSPTIHEETVFQFPPADTLDSVHDYRKVNHDSGIYGTPGPIVFNREYFDFDPGLSPCLTRTPIKYERRKSLRKESEASSGTGSLSGPSRESIVSSSVSQPIAEEEQLLPPIIVVT